MNTTNNVAEWYRFIEMKQIETDVENRECY